MHQRIFREDHVKLAVGKWQAAGLHQPLGEFAHLLDEGGHVDRYRLEVLPVKLAIDRWYVERATPWTDVVVGWSMVQRFVLGRSETAVERLVRAQVPEAEAIARP